MRDFRYDRFAIPLEMLGVSLWHPDHSSGISAARLLKLGGERAAVPHPYYAARAISSPTESARRAIFELSPNQALSTRASAVLPRT